MDTYEENLTLRNNLTLRAKTRRVPTITGVVRMANNSKLEGFHIEKYSSGDSPVIVEAISNVEIAHNTIKLEAYAPNDVLCAVKVLQPLFTNPADSINIHNNIILTRATGANTTGLGLVIQQSNPSDTSYLVPLNGVKVVNNTIDVTSDKAADGIHLEINNYYDGATKASGIVVKNNIISSPVGTRTRPNYCINKVQSGLWTYLPVKYNDCFLRNKSRSDSIVSILVEIINPDPDQEKDPQYEDYGNNDFHLSALYSPCIDSGDPTDNYSLEPEAGTLSNMCIDMGAYGNTPEATIRGVGLEFAGFKIIEKTRIGRTVFGYVLSLSLTNITDSDMTDVYVRLIDESDPVIGVDDDEILFPQIDANSTADSSTFGDYFVIRVDRSELIIPSTIRLMVNGFRIEISGSITGDLTGEGKVDFSDLAELAGQWLWTGTAGEIQEDIVPDGTVNLADFARLAQQWGTD
jgi:hypothetical protein